jgi:mRNA-degrading endonuclease toxin of MazEF toxin-antitoxin module
MIALTSRLTAIRFPGTVLIPASELNGLSTDAVALVFQTRAVDRQRFTGRLGQCENDHLSLVFDELDKMTGRFDSAGE